MRTCYRCGKLIKGETVHHIPPQFAIRLGTDFPKSFHPRCYRAAEAAAARELQGAL